MKAKALNPMLPWKSLMGISLKYCPVLGPPNIVRHPYNRDPKRDPNLENYPHSAVNGPLNRTQDHGLSTRRILTHKP